MAIINGTALANVLNGGAGNDTINGLAGNDTLNGLAGNDTLDGGTGNDKMTGGLGNDTYVVDSTLDTVTELAGAGSGIDLVKSSISYTLGANLENLTLTGTKAINGTGNTLNNVLTGNSGNNVLNGSTGNDTMIGGLGNDTYVVNAAGDVVTEATPAGGTDTVQSSVTRILGANQENLVLTGTAAINGIGNTLANTMTGNTGNNVLSGGVGNDTLDGGLGNDIMIGGAGNDILVVSAAGDTVTEAANGGIDTIKTGLTFSLSALVNVENLTLTGTGSINGTGNGLANILIGNSGKNVLDGGEGNDTLDGGLGNDTMKGGLGDDTFVVNVATDVVFELPGGGTDTVQSAVSWTLGANLENLVLAGTADSDGFGNALGNAITGNGGTNLLIGGLGNDTLNGGAGDDILFGGDGDDTFVVDSALDLLFEEAGEGTDLVQSSVTYTLEMDLDNLTLTGSANIDGTGNELDNTLLGNSGNNVLEGGDGNDFLAGNDGDDTLIGGDGDDTYVVESPLDEVFEDLDGGTDTVQAWFTYSLDVLVDVENLTLTGDDFINGTGNTLANIIIGNDGNNVLDGGGGDDTLNGVAGEDTLFGGAGDDVLVWNGDEDEDSFDGGVDTDTLRVEGAGVSISLATVAGTTVVDMEAIDLAGSGDNFLFFSAADVMALSSSSDTLRVDADFGDVVTSGDNWTEFDTIDIDGVNYIQYASGGAMLLLPEDAGFLFIDFDPVAVDDDNAGDPVLETGFGEAGDPDAAGNVLANDTVAAPLVTAVLGGDVGMPFAAAFGSMTINADGSYAYTLDNMAADLLAEGQTAADVFTYTMTDSGEESTATLTITITGSNDAPVAALDLNADDALVEAAYVGFGDAFASGNVLANDTDADAAAGELQVAAVTNGVVGGPIAGLYGTVTINANGSYIYILDNAAADVLMENSIESDVFSYLVTDAFGATSTESLFIQITGANDAPLAVDDNNAGNAVIEAGFGVAGDAFAAGNVLANDSDVDGAAGALQVVSVFNDFDGNSAGSPVVGTYGTVTIGANGAYTYVLNNIAVDSLGQDQAVIDVFSYVVLDEFGAESEAELTITITGTNDAPAAEIDFVDEGEVVEDFDAFAAGNVLDNDSDPDGAHEILQVTAVAGAAINVGEFLEGIYGFVTINSDGSYTYELNDGDPDTNALESFNAVDFFDYDVTDEYGATSTAQLQILVTGRNDEPSGTDNLVFVPDTSGIYTFAAGDFGFTDPGEGGGLIAVTISTLPGSGTFLFYDDPVFEGQSISVLDIDSNALTFVQDTGPGGGSAIFTFQVQDGGGTNNGGQDLDQSPNTMTVGLLSGDYIGSADNDTFISVAGNLAEVILGLSGNDILDGGEGADYIDGGLGDDTILGGAGDDTIFARSGFDQLTGGTGLDTIQVGGGDTYLDQVIYTATDEGAAVGQNTGYDFIQGFFQSEDVIRFDGAIATAIDDDGSIGTVSFVIDTVADFTDTTGVDALLVASAFPPITDEELLDFGTLTARIAGLGGVTAAAGEDGLIVVHGNSQTGVYYYLEGDGFANQIGTGELSLIAIIESALLDQTNFTIGV